MVDVLIVGAGPAGWALAWCCTESGLHTAVLAPAPTGGWPATYGGWFDEFGHLPASAFAARPPATTVITRTEQRVPRDYVVLDNDGLGRWLRHPSVRTITGTAEEVTVGNNGATVRLTDGQRIAAAVVVDASGVRRALSGGPPRGAHTEQTAVGVRVPAGAVGGLADPEVATLMDWRPAPGALGASGQAASFCYRVPVGHGQMLIEETSLARRPGLPHEVLRERLHARLAAAGLADLAPHREERVRVPLDLTPRRTGEVLAFGVAAGLVHPATGYSLASSLRLAQPVATAIAEALPRSPAAAVRAAQRTIWSSSAFAVHGLRRYGLRSLRRMPPESLNAFFEAFFAQPAGTQRAYLSVRDDVAGTTAAMRAVFHASPPSVRRHLLRASVP
ncbi:MAG: lycopene cyclase [Pseudonocardiaceae bacterium]|nr:lycopene cyclase [Pseudonocardiaceae bacterium]